MEDKKYYLIKTLSRTKRKDYENYVINRLYNRLNDLEIKPMTQKYVKRNIAGKNGYALIDLYFPQFNIGIECDEAHHISQEEQDKLRTEDIIGELDNYHEQRIIVFDKTLKDINNALDTVVQHIKIAKKEQVKKGTFKKWKILTPQEYFKDKDKITIFDDIQFNNSADVCNIIFNLCYNKSQMQR